MLQIIFRISILIFPETGSCTECLVKFYNGKALLYES
jgi:hypothetical protein